MRRAKKFKLVPKAATLRMLTALNLKAVVVGKNVTLKPRVPRGGGCFVFSPPCRAARFFKKVGVGH